MIKNREYSFFVLTIIIFILIFSNSAIAQIKTGILAPDFSLSAPDGEIYQLSNFNNKQDHLFLCFAKEKDADSFNNIDKLIAFLTDYQPRESYQIITLIETEGTSDETLAQYLSWQEKTEIPFLVLLDKGGKTAENYNFTENSAILILRADLHIRRIYDRFTSRQEDNLYQYLTFIFTPQTSNGGSGCDEGVCPPPPGY